MKQLHLKLDAAIAELGRLEAGVLAFCRRNGLDERLRHTLQLVCDEWITNIVTHGYGGSPPANGPPAIELWLRICDEDRVELVIVDGAPFFDPTTHPEPDVTLPLERREAGGLGIHIIKRMMDRIEYVRADGRNRLKLTKMRRMRKGVETDERND